jgi:hypothetical protein
MWAGAVSAVALDWSPPVRRPSARVPFYVMLLGFPVWWALGAWAFVWPLLAIPLVLALLVRHEIRVPPFFALWLLFLVWVMVSAASLEGENTVLGFAFRAGFYVAATVVMLYVFNTSHALLPTGTVLNAVTAYLLVLVLGGLVAVLVPDLGWTSLLEHLLPASLLDVQFVRDLVHPTLAQPSDFLGYDLARPHPFFAYTNEWGSTVALLAPVAIAAREASRSPAWRRIIVVGLVCGIVPLVLSLNRGAWISLIVATAFVAIRLLVSGRLRNVARIAALALALTGVVYLTGGSDVISDRIRHGHSDRGRGELYAETVTRSMERPFLGHGAPRPSEVSPGLPSVGTHGQWFLVLFSQGIPGLVFVLSWVAAAFFALRRPRSSLSLCAQVCLLIAFVQGFYYELVPMQLPLLALVVALAWRERAPVPTSSGLEPLVARPLMDRPATGAR